MAAWLSANSAERMSIFETIWAIGFVALRVAELSDSPIIQRFWGPMTMGGRLNGQFRVP